MKKIKCFFPLKQLVVILTVVLLAFSVGCARKGPYLIYAGNNTSVTVVWQLGYSLNEGETCEIEWGTDYTYGNSAGVTENGSGTDEHIYSYTISGLSPGTNYKYRVFLPDGTDHQEYAFYSASFTTPPPDTATSLKFYAYGDVRGNYKDGYSVDAHEAVAAAMVNYYRKVDPDFQTFTLSTGDIIFLGGDESHWDTQLFNKNKGHVKALLANAPYISAIGNHETYGTGQPVFVKYFDYPYVTADPAVDGTFWSFDYGPAHFAIVDQYVAYDSASAQFGWLAGDLAASTKEWNFIVFHEPGYSAGGHAGKAEVKALIDDLFINNPAVDIDMVINGHNHHYVRAVDSYGIQHVVTGGGGAELKHLWDPSTNDPSNDPYWDAEVITAKECHCYTRITIDGSTLSLTTVAVVPDTVYDYVITVEDGCNCMFADPDDGIDTICDGDIIDTATIPPPT